jgi:hypothetical protein
MLEVGVTSCVHTTGRSFPRPRHFFRGGIIPFRDVKATECEKLQYSYTERLPDAGPSIAAHRIVIRYSPFSHDLGPELLQGMFHSGYGSRHRPERGNEDL